MENFVDMNNGKHMDGLFQDFLNYNWLQSGTETIGDILT